MKRIQSIADIEELKARGTIPHHYLVVIDTQFQEWYEAENTGESLDVFQLPIDSCIYHLEDEKDGGFILDQLIHVEYVEIEEVDGYKYFRIGIMNDHQMNLVFFLEGTLQPRTQGLRENSGWESE
jgi:hypothetical protein